MSTRANLEEYDLVILGGGTGGTVAAWTFAAQGQRVAVIERKYIGGSCPNIACLPSKNIIQSAKIVSYFRRSREFGINNGSFTVDMSALTLSPDFPQIRLVRALRMSSMPSSSNRRRNASLTSSDDGAGLEQKTVSR
jgi:choline dehydrogenase-like flavoprotein